MRKVILIGLVVLCIVAVMVVIAQTSIKESDEILERTKWVDNYRR